MIKTYKYNYNWHDASAYIEIDPNKLSENDAQKLYDFFSWDDSEEPEGDIYDRLGYQYCRVAMKFATIESHNTQGVKSDFEASEGFLAVDGSQGITLVDVEGIDFSNLEMERE